MKILHIIASANPKAGGPIEGIKQLGRQLLTHNSRNEVVSLDDPNEPFVAEFPLKLYPLGPHISTYAYTSKLAPWLYENAKNYDLIIINGIWQYNSFGACRVLKKLNIPYYVFTHGMLDPWFKHTYPLKHLKKWLYWPWAEYRVLKDAKAVLFTCAEEKLLAAKSFWLYKTNGKVVNYGVASPPSDSDTLKQQFFHENPSLVNKRLLIFLSRIHEKKGCDILISAFSEIAKSDSNYHLIMAGPSSKALREKLQLQAESLGVQHRITWTGMLQGDMKWGAYYASEAFVLPSHQENFGIVVAEALACGLPVLISNKVNIWREIQQGEAGYVEEDTVSGTVNNLQKWVKLNDSAKAEMAKRAINTFQAHFHVKAMAKSLLSLQTNTTKED